MSSERYALAWDHGVLAVQSLSGMLGPVLFLLPDGRQVAPLQVAAWGNDPERKNLPGVLQELRGDWACVPFGFDGVRELTAGWDPDGESFEGAGLAHGICSNTEWTLVEHTDRQIVLECLYPDEHPVHLVRRIITPDPEAPAIDLKLEIVSRRKCRLPVGVHPTFRLPSELKSVIIEPNSYRFMHTFPGDLEPGAAILAPGVEFERLSEAPFRKGGSIDVSALPLDIDFEELIQIAGLEGEVALHYRDEGFRVRLLWDEKHFPSALLWMSNRGRRAWPWSGKHLAIAIEPVASAFDLGPAISTGNNPIARTGISTAIDLDPGSPFSSSYRIEVEPVQWP